MDAHISLLRELVPSKICRFSKQQSAPVGFDTLIFPFKGPKAPKVKADYLPLDPECATANATCARIATGFGTDYIVISSTPGTALSFDHGKIKTTASALVIRTDKKGRVIHAFTDSGSATYNGKPVDTYVKQASNSPTTMLRGLLFAPKHLGAPSPPDDCMSEPAGAHACPTTTPDW